ncbi:hypothetical protein E2C01_033694 [Portunus trituberculatus]|uniref:Uncharacterized protein n=1 Tax=Portunus trituberculatus TaxID=210409 RepID=A0A5B7F4F9_PORTR|nr:hypothetical protein [Portunus trituberculatus]
MSFLQHLQSSTHLTKDNKQQQVLLKLSNYTASHQLFHTPHYKHTPPLHYYSTEAANIALYSPSPPPQHLHNTTAPTNRTHNLTFYSHPPCVAV